ncbi:MAG: biotin--[acetyl-CoA-carboxylase] ligase [Bacteroidota bacterium]|nr:biotin--[acetyl-CoA-carboxylase] ligase [Bacteroidota bacterium]
MKIIRIKQTKSTNSYAQEYIKSEPTEDFTCFVADEQTAGKGQRGNSWYSTPGESLTFSIALKPNLKTVKQFMLSKVVSLSIVSYFSKYGDLFSIKWPNDIYYNNRKLCGILIENSLSGNKIKKSIVGIGINIDNRQFPENLLHPISLTQITEKKHNTEQILNGLLREIKKHYNQLAEKNFDAIDNAYLENLYKYNEEASFKDKICTYRGKITGISPYGNLIVKNIDTGISTAYAHKEVEFIY